MHSMINYDISKIYPEYNYLIDGVSYIGNPKSHTALFVTYKIADKIKNLNCVEQCLVYTDKSIEVSDEIRNKHAVIQVENPQLEYVRFVTLYENQHRRIEATYRYIFHKEGYCISENAKIGKNAIIEPGCKIGHNVTIGDDAVILSGTIINNAEIGDGFLANEYAVIGANGFTIIEDENGNKLRMPSLGRVRIHNNVEVGVHNNISRGSNGCTTLEDNVKLDAFVHIGHDAIIHKNTELTAGVVVGGYDEIFENVFVGLNSSLKNRIEVGANTVIGMGTNVLKSIEKDSTVVGNPAKKIH